MNEPDNGGPAFPIPMFTRKADGQPMHAGEFFNGGCGMTLRDYFATAALAGLPLPQVGELDPMEFARAAYDIADAMLKVRNI